MWMTLPKSGPICPILNTKHFSGSINVRATFQCSIMLPLRISPHCTLHRSDEKIHNFGQQNNQEGGTWPLRNCKFLNLFKTFYFQNVIFCLLGTPTTGNGFEGQAWLQSPQKVQFLNNNYFQLLTDFLPICCCCFEETPSKIFKIWGPLYGERPTEFGLGIVFEMESFDTIF